MRVDSKVTALFLALSLTGCQAQPTSSGRHEQPRVDDTGDANTTDAAAALGDQLDWTWRADASCGASGLTTRLTPAETGPDFDMETRGMVNVSTTCTLNGAYFTCDQAMDGDIHVDISGRLDAGSGTGTLDLALEGSTCPYTGEST